MSRCCVSQAMKFPQCFLYLPHTQRSLVRAQPPTLSFNILNNNDLNNTATAYGAPHLSSIHTTLFPRFRNRQPSTTTCFACHLPFACPSSRPSLYWSNSNASTAGSSSASLDVLAEHFFDADKLPAVGSSGRLRSATFSHRLFIDKFYVLPKWFPVQ